MSRPEPPQTAPVSTGLSDEEAVEALVAKDLITQYALAPEALAENGLTVADVVEDGATAADAAAAGLPEAPEEEEPPPPPDSLVLSAEEERYLAGHDPDRNRGLPQQEIEHVDDWDDMTATDQENTQDFEQQG